METAATGCDSDLTDDQRALVEPLLPKPFDCGAPRTTDFRRLLDAMFYVVSNGIKWINLPNDFPPEGAVRWRFHQWRRSGRPEQVHAALRERVRVGEGHAADPSAGSLDSQSAKAAGTSGTRGFDAGKKISGVKRHLLADTLGLVWVAVVHSAGLQDRDGARPVLAKAKIEGVWPRMQVLWADGGYAGWLAGLVSALLRWSPVIIRRTDNEPGFRLLPKRWVVERTFGWLSNYRRLSRHTSSTTRPARR